MQQRVMFLHQTVIIEQPFDLVILQLQAEISLPVPDCFDKFFTHFRVSENFPAIDCKKDSGRRSFEENRL